MFGLSKTDLIITLESISFGHSSPRLSGYRARFVDFRLASNVQRHCSFGVLEDRDGFLVRRAFQTLSVDANNLVATFQTSYKANSTNRRREK